MDCSVKIKELKSVAACYYCSAVLEPKTRTIDHVIPLAAGGQHRPENLVAACRNCNFSKGKKSPEEWVAAKR